MSTVSRVDPNARERVGFALALSFVVVGGLVAAVTGPLSVPKGSWLAAYLVLVTGVALGLLSSQRRIIDSAQGNPGREWAVISAWIGGSALVVTGALAGLPILTDLGGVAMVGVLFLALLGTHGAKRKGLAWVLRVSYVALVLSIPIGLTLTHLRNA